MKTPYKILGPVVLAVTQAVAQSPSQPASPTISGASPNVVQPINGTLLPAAHPISTVDPKYPKEARKQKRQGSVALRVTIGVDGKVKDLSVVSGDADFAAAATQAVKKWRFEPYLVDGKPTQTDQNVTVNFTLPKEVPALSSGDFNKEVEARTAAGELFHVGQGVTPPRGISLTDPDYSEEARAARFNGTVSLSVIVEADGVPGAIRVTRPVGYGLDEKAVEAVRSWRFIPATKDGKPVAVLINVEVTFHLT